jgi:hypothetical protein
MTWPARFAARDSDDGSGAQRRDTPMRLLRAQCTLRAEFEAEWHGTAVLPGHGHPAGRLSQSRGCKSRADTMRPDPMPPQNTMFSFLPFLLQATVYTLASSSFDQLS